MQVDYIVLHCTESPNNLVDTRLDTAEDIHRWHKERGFQGIGYHWVIREDGKREAGRPEFWQGAHVRGYNHNSIGVALVGNGYFHQSQMSELDRLISELLGRYPEARVVGHNELDSSKTCPNFDVQEWNNGRS